MRNFLRILRLAIALSLAVSTMLFVVWSRRWPLVGDASMIHYIVFMIEHGKAPYRDLVEMSMPGTFLIEMAAMKVFGDGATGWPEHAPYDGIIVTAAGPMVPPALVAQLRPGGRMVIPLGEPFGDQMLTVVTRDMGGIVTQRDTLPVAFVPLVEARPTPSRGENCGVRALVGLRPRARTRPVECRAA